MHSSISTLIQWGFEILLGMGDEYLMIGVRVFMGWGASILTLIESPLIAKLCVDFSSLFSPLVYALNGSV
jgi:hypothetical protein